MFLQEAMWIEAILAGLSIEELQPVIDIGSSDLEYRTVRKPWIEKHIFAPLKRRGVSIVFCDMKKVPGVDIAVDLMTEEGLTSLQTIRPCAVLCCNVLEHVPDPRTFAASLSKLLQSKGRLILTVPYHYPKHNDPIDTMFRPNDQELAALFPEFTIEFATILTTGSYREEFLRRPLTLFLRHILRLPVPFLGWVEWKRSVGKLRYLIQPYQVTCVALLKH